jgi:hypothetical protein
LSGNRSREEVMCHWYVGDISIPDLIYEYVSRGGYVMTKGLSDKHPKPRDLSGMWDEDFHYR